MECIKYMRQILLKIHKFALNTVIKFRKLGCVSCLALTGLLCLVPLIIIACVKKNDLIIRNDATIYVDTQDGPLHIVNENFLSLGLDSSLIAKKFQGFNMTNPKLIKLIKYLSPAYLRLGGNQADQIIFDESSTINSTSTLYSFTGSDWLKLYNLAQLTNLSIIYDLNALLRYSNGSWNSENAEKMINFSSRHNLSLDWELGNEPQSFESKFNISVNATELAKSFHTLRNILNQYDSYKNSFLMGPSTSQLRNEKFENYFINFLVNGSSAVNAITWHHGMNATPTEFLDYEVFDYLEVQIKKIKRIVSNLNITNKPIWIGETSSAFHSGAPNLSDRFIGSFIWIDKLGLSARLGIDLLVRQSLFQGNYALLDDNYQPNPDWWLSIFYKQIVSKSVLSTKIEGNKNIRLYAHCAKKPNIWHKEGSGVVVFGVNLSRKWNNVNIKELKTKNIIYVFEFTTEGPLESKNIFLNGQKLDLLPNNTLPKFEPKITSFHPVLKIPPTSIVFWLFPQSNVKAC